MKHIFVIVLLLISSVIPVVVHSQDVKKKVAVYITGDVDGGYKKVIGSKLVSGVTQQQDYAAVERTNDFLAELAKEQDYQMSGAVNDSQIVRLGNQFGVLYVLVADVSEVFESMFVSARLIDVQTGLIIASVEKDKEVKNIDDLTELAQTTVSDMFDGFKREAAEKELKKWNLKITGPYNSAEQLWNRSEPVGYRMADASEIELITKLQKTLGIEINYPIYCNFKSRDDLHYTNKLGEPCDAYNWVESKSIYSYNIITDNIEEGKLSYYWCIINNIKATPTMSKTVNYDGLYKSGGYIYWIAPQE